VQSVGPESTVARRLGVPFLDLGRLHRELKSDVLAAISELVDSNAFTNGPHVRQFEQAFAAWCGASRCVGMASGLDALRLALIAAGIERGDEVVVPANTFVATFEAVTQAGGRPVPADVTEEDYNLDPEAVAAAIGPRTRFLLPVHLYGQMADMRALREISERHDLRIVEDACQAHGASRDGLRAGTAGLAGAFSFYPGKNLGAMGDAGALVTDDEELASSVEALREHGQRAKYHHELEGYTARLDTIQALVLLRKLPELERWNDERQKVARSYSSSLAGVGDLRLPPVPAGSDPVWHLYAVRTAAPQSLADFLADRAIGTGRHYPEPAHLSPAYSWLGLGEGAFPVTEALSAELLSLPIFPGMTGEEIAMVVDAVSAYFERG
jgi:dTDP-4-amino-4,6-dideoxygalactose transaminase